eukprot:gene21136-25896_t
MLVAVVVMGMVVVRVIMPAAAGVAMGVGVRFRMGVPLVAMSMRLGMTMGVRRVIVPMMRVVVIMGCSSFGRCGVVVFRLTLGVFMAFFAVTGFAFVALMAMIMCLEGAAFAEFQLLKPGHLAEFHHLGAAAQGIERLVEKGLKAGSDPEHHLGRLKCRSVRWLH